MQTSRKEPGSADENRRDVVGRSGVYPMSGPHPQGDAPIRSQMSWGQGERGDAGYADHGGSELLPRGDVVLGGLDQEWARIFEQEMAESKETQREIPAVCWTLFCDWFTKHHAGIHTTEVVSDADMHPIYEARGLPLVELTAHVMENRVAGISVRLNRRPNDHLVNITTPRRIVFARTTDGLPESIWIEEEHGQVLLRFDER